MDNQQIAVKLIFDKLGLSFNMDTFQDRLILQKSIYLVQSLGTDLGYHFSWYLKGPYSASLATDGFSIRDELDIDLDESKKWKLDDSLARRLDNIQSWFSETEKKVLAKKLELFASVHFLVKRKNIGKDSTSELVQTLMSFGKEFSDSEVKGAVRELLQYGAIN